MHQSARAVLDAIREAGAGQGLSVEDLQLLDTIVPPEISSEDLAKVVAQLRKLSRNDRQDATEVLAAVADALNDKPVTGEATIEAGDLSETIGPAPADLSKTASPALIAELKRRIARHKKHASPRGVIRFTKDIDLSTVEQGEVLHGTYLEKQGDMLFGGFVTLTIESVREVDGEKQVTVQRFPILIYTSTGEFVRELPAKEWTATLVR
jgi:hypothetical protein